MQSPIPHRHIVFEPSGKRIGDYQLGSLIGGGGMGSVYIAKQISLQRLAAVKVLRKNLADNPVYMGRFLKEVRLVAKMEHPYLVRAYEAGVDKGQAYFAMEYVAGVDLKTYLKTQKRLPEQDVLHIAEQTALILKYAWDHCRMIHRDIKPANIMITEDGSCKLLDLGISKQVCEADGMETLTETNMMVGSPTYISPEQARGQKDIDCRADVYSLGITMYHLLTGAPPYSSPSPMETIAMHFKMPVPNIRAKNPEISKNTALLVQDMMAKTPEERPEWDEVLAMLRTHILPEKSSEIHRMEPAPAQQGDSSACNSQNKGKKPFRRRIVAVTVILLLLAAVIAGAFCIRLQRKKTVVKEQEQSRYVTLLLCRQQQPEKYRIIKKPNQPLYVTTYSSANAPAAGTPEISDEQRENELRYLTKLSSDLEEKKKFREAIEIWEKYCPPDSLKEDRPLQRKIKSQIEYLKSCLKAYEDEHGTTVEN